MKDHREGPKKNVLMTIINFKTWEETENFTETER